MKMMTNDLLQSSITMGIDSEEVMKQPSGLVMGDD
jgi:hypothetical protein